MFIKHDAIFENTSAFYPEPVTVSHLGPFPSQRRVLTIRLPMFNIHILTTTVVCVKMYNLFSILHGFSTPITG